MAQWSRDVKIRAKLSSNYWVCTYITAFVKKWTSHIGSSAVFLTKNLFYTDILLLWKVNIQSFFCFTLIVYQNWFYFWIPTITTTAVIITHCAWVLLVENLRRLHSLLPMEKRSLLYSCYLPSPLVASEIIKCTFVPFVSCTSSLF